MAAFVEGEPCWADAMLPDLEAGKRFYGELLGWTFDEGDDERHSYTLARRDDKIVAGLIAKPDGRMPTVWNVYFASPDLPGTAARVRKAGGQIITGPAVVGEAGSLLMAADPGDAVFGVWQGAGHVGFQERNGPGSFCWTELYARDKDAVDPFYRQVFGFDAEQIGQADGPFDYEVWTVKGERGPEGGGAVQGEDAEGEEAEREEKVYVGGRMRMGADSPAELPSHFVVYFGVEDCDRAVATVRRLGGKVDREPQDSPHGRLASVVDNQGTHFTVIDISRRTGQE
ncbi:VOC family protein [Streptomyces sp. PTM05]|uniref:VOC family protein n=1 Tax=Streptantibioticus parmotrematis TaxID=2873249 RepID=A0ABS7QNW0_9ACTN|nr:VOC family protein [Streptantibioticus parmotrematis]MBY8884862.1 VOC family protein [Streptantibioticus parmotrematis]